jgi:adenylate cyclase
MVPSQCGDLPAMDDANRRLAGILAADVVGYSAMVGTDEPGTLARVRSLRGEVVEPVAATHGGRLFKTTGDGFLIAFASAVQALRCAIAIQERLRSEPDGLRLRIGVHQGEVVAEGDDLLGDGVIIAARLEPLAEPGGICISARVREDAAGKMVLEVNDLGTPELKGIAGKVQVFRVRLGMPERPALLLPDRPSVAVLAFTNMSGDLEQEYFSDGIADDIITELSRSRALFVIARNSSFTYKGRAVDVKQVARELGVRYVIEGSVRRSGGRARVTAQLIDAETGNHVWAERYDRDVNEVFAVQDEITAAVVAAIQPAIADAELQRTMRKAPENLGAWEAYQRGLWHMRKAGPLDSEQAQTFFQRAMSLDASFAPACAAMASTYLLQGAIYATRPLQDALGLASYWARRAIEIDANDAEAHAALAWSTSGTGDLAAAWEHLSLALASNPNSAWANCIKGGLLAYGGRQSEGRQALLIALRLSPRDPLEAFSLGLLAAAYYFEHDYARALEAARRAVSRYPALPMGHRFLAVTLGQLGRADEARGALQRAVEVSPQYFELYARRRMPWWRAEDHEHVLDGLRKAGWQG